MKSHMGTFLTATGLLPKIVDSINATSSLAIGFQTPGSVKSSADEPRIRNAQKHLAETLTPSEREKHFPAFLSWRQQEENMKEYDEATKHSFSIGQYVYLDPPRGAFDKSHD
jgi:hypothetical protein